MSNQQREIGGKRPIDPIKGYLGFLSILLLNLLLKMLTLFWMDHIMKHNFELFKLEDLTLEYCKIRGLIIDRNIVRRSEKRIDLFIENDDTKGIGVVIKDWKRAVGVDIIIRAEQIAKTSRLISKILIVSSVALRLCTTKGSCSCSANAINLSNNCFCFSCHSVSFIQL